jgi:hypothetical protein
MNQTKKTWVLLPDFRDRHSEEGDTFQTKSRHKRSADKNGTFGAGCLGWGEVEECERSGLRQVCGRKSVECHLRVENGVRRGGSCL